MVDRDFFRGKITPVYRLAVVALCLFLVGCAPVKRTWKALKFFKRRERIIRPSNSDISRFFSGIRPCPGNYDSHIHLARYFQREGRHKEAVEEFQKAVQIDPNRVEAYNGMGVSFDNLRDFPRAIQSYQTVININPDLFYTYNNLGYSLVLQGEYGKAVEAFKKGIALNQHNSRLRQNLGMAYALLKQDDLALKEFKVVLNENEAYKTLARIYALAGKSGQAQKQMAEAVPLENPTAEILPKVDAPKIIDQQPSDSGMENPDPEADVWIEIANGNGVRHMARDTKNYLEIKGAKIAHITNADHFHYEKTFIYYQKDYVDLAIKIGKLIPGIQNLKMREKFNQPQTGILILLGKDMNPLRGKLLQGCRG